MPDKLRIGLLGSLTIDHGHASRPGLPSATQRRLLSILALQAGHTLSTDRLCELLDCTSGSLRTSVSRLRTRVGPDNLRTSPPGYVLLASSDVAEFESLVVEAGARADESSLAVLDRALALWRGEVVEEFRDESWAIHEGARLEELRAAAIERRADALVSGGMFAQAIPDLRSHIGHHPLREHPQATLMRALAESGRSTEALRVYQDFRRHLVTTTGTEPSDALRELEHAIARGPTEDGEQAVSIPVEARAFLVGDIDGPGSPPAGGSDPGRAHDSAVDDLWARVVAENRGVEIWAASGSLAAAFDHADDAVAAAIGLQQRLGRDPGVTPPDGVRVGVHFGTAARRDDRWYGPILDETHRIAGVGHVGQIVASSLVAALVDVRLTDLGEHRLRDIEGAHRLFQVDVPGGRDQFPVLRSVGAHPSTLPAQRTTLIGRDDQVVRVRGQIGEHRLVSLIGPGGVGKTRLAIEAAGQSIGAFPGGVFFADLTRALTPQDVAAVVRRSMKAPIRTGETDDEAIIAFLADRTALLVVDNCEHLLDRAAETIDDVLTGASDTRVLATTREPLRLHGEQRLIVPSLDVEGPHSPGVRLFVERARETDGTVADHDGGVDGGRVGAIVRRLDGIPLAIELAAARTATLTPSEILELLDDRFALLSQRLRRVPLRHQTLAATVAWSYDLLSPDEQRAFRYLAACAGAFSLSTASRVLDLSEVQTADLLESLRTKSLLTHAPGGADPGGFDLLETLREYGRSMAVQVGEGDLARSAVEDALLPTSEVREDWSSLVNRYVCAADPASLIEDTTRLAAATLAQEEGRLDNAALIFGSIAYRADLGALRARSALVSPLAARRAELDPVSWCVANASKLLLERGARDYGAVLQTAGAMVYALEAGDPARTWFELWQCALATAVDPAGGIDAIDAVLPVASRAARPPLDWTLSQLLGAKATGLALLRRLDEAAPIAAEAAAWAPLGVESRDQMLALRVWFGYLRGVPMPEELAHDVAGQAHDLGLAELCAAPGALCGGGTVPERAARLVEAARRRPKLDIPTPYLLAFAWLAIEAGDRERARALVAKAELYDSSTQVALLYALAAIDRWSEEDWTTGREAMVATYLSTEQEHVARSGAVTLDEEVDRWHRQLADVSGDDGRS